jgi:hypothetical protein
MLKRPSLAAAAVMTGGAAIVTSVRATRGTHPLWAGGGALHAISLR